MKYTKASSSVIAGAHEWYFMVDYNFPSTKKKKSFLFYDINILSFLQTPGDISPIPTAFGITGKAQR